MSRGIYMHVTTQMTTHLTCDLLATPITDLITLYETVYYGKPIRCSVDHLHRSATPSTPWLRRLHGSYTTRH